MSLQTALDFTTEARPLYRRNNPATSRQAAERVVRSGRAATHEASVLRHVLAHPGLTSGELAAWHSEYDLTETRRRLTGLLNKGRVWQGTARLCTVQGTRQVTWFAVEL